MFRYKKSVAFENLEKELDQFSEKIEGLKLPKGFSKTVLYITSEIFANIKEHSHAGKTFINIKIGKKNAEIDIADDGIGFRTSYLRKKIYPKDDFSAIEFALSGLSTKDSQERGFDLYSIKKLAEALGGQLMIKTGLAEATIEKNRITFHKLKKRTVGTLIGFKSPIKSVNFYKII